MGPKAIVTIPPYAPFIREVAAHPAVSGLRLNTVMPLDRKDSIEDVLKRLNQEAQQFGRELWIDLKCRQLRIATYGVPPFTEIEITNSISVDMPVTAYFSDGQERATVIRADGKRLIMQEGPRRVVGPGEAINIPHPSLSIEGYLTDTDKRYIEAAVNANLHNYMLSFVEQKEDIESLKMLDPNAVVVAKIESRKGLQYATSEWNKESRLMAARGDLFVEVKMPHDILMAQELIAKKDENAIVASRILTSLAYSLEPSCADIGDLDNLLRMGYKTVMLGDDVCMQRDSVMSALNLFAAITERYR